MMIGGVRMHKDIFISYRNDGEGNNFAARLKDDLDYYGYSVYFNSHERGAGEFPLRLRNAIEQCKDFILILSAGCIKKLCENEQVDWVREEILCAQKNKKNILPILLDNVMMPQKVQLPDALQFICDLDAMHFPEQYLQSPFQCFVGMLVSKAEKEVYKDVANSSLEYNADADFRSTLAKAESGDTNAMFDVACMYAYSFYSSEGSNYMEAGKWLKTYIDNTQNKPEKTNDEIQRLTCARSMLANLYYSGSVPHEEQSFHKTIELLEAIASESTVTLFAEACIEKLIFMMADGVGTAFDFQRILACFEKFQDKCSNNAINNMAKFYMRYGMYREAVDVLESVEDSYPDIEYKLGIIYLQGIHNTPPQPDVYRAEHYLKRAADGGHLDALHAIGLLNFRGQYGYRKNLNKAREYFHLAATRGHRGAQYDYAWMCKYGLGGERDIYDATRYFEESANKGHALSMAELALIYQSPDYINYQKAFEWAKKAALTGNSQSEFILGNLYYFGRGCESNSNEAVLWYKKSLNHGFYQAKFMLDKLKVE